MRIPDLSYSFENDQRVYREANLKLGALSVAAEAITVNGHTDRGNQDAFGSCIGDDGFYFMVLDGAVSREASHRARDLFELSPDRLTARQRLSYVNKGLAAFDLQGGASTGTIIEITKAGNIQLAHVTDSWAMALLKDGSTRLLTLDQHERFDRQVLQYMARIAIGQGVDLQTARRDPRVRRALTDMFQRVRNAPDGRGEGILNGSRFMDMYIQSLHTPLKVADVEMVLIGSDGSRFPHRAQSETDPAYRSELFSLVALHGVERVVDMIHQDEIAHPPTSDHPRWSLHDDKTLFALRPSLA